MQGNKTKKLISVGFIGWRGMVGAVLQDRLIAEKNFDVIHPVFFSTSQINNEGPGQTRLQDGYDLAALAALPILVSCQGSEYTQKIHGALRQTGWTGYWIDAASFLRLKKESVLVLDPVNDKMIDHALETGVKDFIGANCTVSLMLMALSGLLKAGVVDWVASMTYQAASGAGAAYVEKLINDMNTVTGDISNDLSVLKKMNFILERQNLPGMLAANLLPWIDSAMETGQTREEWKGRVEAEKILGAENAIPMDGLCVRVPVMRCHSQALTIQLNQSISIKEISAFLKQSHAWLDIVPNEAEATLSQLTPAAVSNTLRIRVGRLRALDIGENMIAAFTVGDQLLWGAAEPLRRVLMKIVSLS